jgi:hypothetical protein
MTIAAARAPGIGSAVRRAVADLYFHSIRLVPANLAWGLGLIVILGLIAAGAVLPAVALAPLLALPLVAIARLAGEIARSEEVVLSDAWHAVRELAWPALAAGAIAIGATLVLLSNVRLGLTSGTVPAMAMAVGAGWGLVALWLVAFPFWILLADPARRGRGALMAARESAGLLLVEPARLLGLALVVTVVIVVGSVLVAAVLAVAVAYAALVTARVVLPVADRLAGSPEYASSRE